MKYEELENFSNDELSYFTNEDFDFASNILSEVEDLKNKEILALEEEKKVESVKVNKSIEKPSKPQDETKLGRTTTITTTPPDNKMMKILIGVLVVALLGVGGYALVGNDNDTGASKSQSENIEMTSLPKPEDEVLVNVNNLMLKANSESSAMQELKKVRELI